MNKAIVRCRCGHQVLAKEVLRTDLYERSSGREYIYLKFRCARCKRLGQTFIAESKWDWSALEAEQNEFTASERDHFLDEAPISALELLDFHTQLQSISSAEELKRLDANEMARDESAPSEDSEIEVRERPKPSRFDNRGEGGRLRGRHDNGERGNDSPPRAPHPRANGEGDESSSKT